MVGRRHELELTDALLDAALDGRGQFLVVAGEAGVGKSRLAAAVTERGAERGATVLASACLEQLRWLPYWPAAQLVRALVADLPPGDAAARLRAVDPCLPRLLPELDALDGAGAAAELEAGRLAIAVCSLLEQDARARPLVVLLEDLHWADAATIDLVAVLARRLAHSPALVVATHRSDETAARADLADTLADLRGQRLCTNVELAGLEVSDVEVMVRAILEDIEPIGGDAATAVHARTDGNPLYVEELLRALLEAGAISEHGAAWDTEAIAELGPPPSIQDAILRRVRRLPGDAQSLLEVAAVLGDPFDLEFLTELSGLESERMLELARTLVGQQLLAEEELGALRFRHALMRETVYSHLLLAERRLLHDRIATGLERLYEGSLDEHAGELASQHEAAGNVDRARELAVRAAGRASALGALADARGHYATALRLATDPRARFELLLPSGRIAHGLGDMPTAIAELGEAASSAERAGDRRAQARALLELSYAELVNGDRAHALDLRLSVLDLLEPEGECEELAWAYRALGHQHMLGSSYAEAVRWSERAIALGRALGVEAVVVGATVDLGTALPFVGEPERGFELLRECLESRHVEWEAERAAINLSYVLALFGRHEEAIDVSRTGIAFCERSGAEFSRLLCQANLSGSLRFLGRWEESEAQAGPVLATAREIGSNKYLLLTLNELANLRADQGRWEEARGLRDELEPLALARGELQMIAPLSHVSARIEAALGDRGRALRRLDETRRFWREHTDDTVLIAPVLALGAELASGRADAESWLADLEEVAERSSSPDPAVLLEEARGSVHARRRDPEGAAALERAAEGWERHGRPYDTARALRLAGDARLELGERESAVERLRRALELARGLGAAWEAQLATASLRRAGERVPRGPRPSTMALPGGLTRRELEVARLVSQGRTNTEIARTLVISRKTAAAHVSHILGKLGFGTRAEIARWVAEHDSDRPRHAPAGIPR